MALTDAKIRAAKPTDKAYKLTDGAGMFLLVHPNGSRYWRLRYRILGKEKTLALGVYPAVSLSEARTKRDEARKLISEGIDPCEQKSAVMRYAVQSGIIRYNPALDMAGALTTVKRQHRPALDLSRLPELLSRIDSYKGQPVTRLAVMLNLLVFIRSSELRYARWSEIDIENAMWTIPAEREPLPGVKFSHRGSKMRTPHLVPLSKQAVDILTELQTWAGENGLIFTGAHDPRKPISENTVNKALRVMGYDTTQDVCGHGFRAMACSALIESGLWSRDAVERQMSHQERNGVRAAYIHKAEHLEERRLMLQWWADFLDANRERFISPFEYAKINNPLKQ
ncbi:TPA: site-specific integrase [Escherichia coli]|nr:site-specific integrase [Escherichia coli]